MVMIVRLGAGRISGDATTEVAAMAVPRRNLQPAAAMSLDLAARDTDHISAGRNLIRSKEMETGLNMASHSS